MKTPKYRRHSTRDVGFIEWRGKRHYLPGKWDSLESLTAYRKFLRDHVLADNQPANPSFSTSITVAEVVAGFLVYAMDRYGDDANSEYANCYYALTHLTEFAGHAPVTEFGPRKLKEYRQWRITNGNAPGYVNDQVNKIKRAFRWAVSEELIPASVVTGLESVDGLPRHKRKRANVPWEHLEAILPHLSSTIRAMALMQWYTGARSESICFAMPKQFDRTQNPWFWRPIHKTEKIRKTELILPVGPNAQKAIVGFFDVEEDEPLFSPRSVSNNRKYRRFYRVRSYRQALVRAQERVNEQRRKDGLKEFPHWFPHQLRHSRGQLVREKYGVEAAQGILGQDSLDATEIYTTRRLALAFQAALEIG